MQERIVEQESVLTMADSSSDQEKERKSFVEERSDLPMTPSSNPAGVAPAAIIISSNQSKGPEQESGTETDSPQQYLTSTEQLSSPSSLGVAGEHSNYQVIGVAAGEGGEQILVITPYSTPTPVQSTSVSVPPQPSQDTHQPLIINGHLFQAAPSTMSSSEQIIDSAMLAAQFELIKSTCPTLSGSNDHGGGAASSNASVGRVETIKFESALENGIHDRQNMSNNGDNIVVLYDHKPTLCGRKIVGIAENPGGVKSLSSNNVGACVVTQSLLVSETGMESVLVTESISEPMIVSEPATTDLAAIRNDMDEDSTTCPEDDAYRKCVVCLRKRPITRDIFDENHVLNKSMAKLTAYLSIDPKDENASKVGICPPCLDQLLNWHAFSTAIRTRHEAVLSWTHMNFDNVPVNESTVKARLYHNPKKTMELKKSYWSQNGQHSFLTRRHLTDSDWDWICEFLEKHPPPAENEKFLVRSYLHSAEKLTHIFCVYCKRVIENGQRGYISHISMNHPTETDIRYPCELCGGLEDDDSYFSHWISHLYPEKCDKCCEHFPNSKALHVHLVEKHAEKPPVPKKKSSNKNTVITKSTNPKNKDIECPKCGIFLCSPGSLKKHIDYKHYDGPLQHICSLCQKKFRWRYLLTRHERNVHPRHFAAKESEDDEEEEDDNKMEVDAEEKNGDPDKMPERQNHSPDINPAAHINGFPKGNAPKTDPTSGTSKKKAPSNHVTANGTNGKKQAPLPQSFPQPLTANSKKQNLEKKVLEPVGKKKNSNLSKHSSSTQTIGINEKNQSPPMDKLAPSSTQALGINGKKVTYPPAKGVIITYSKSNSFVKVESDSNSEMFKPETDKKPNKLNS